MITRRTFLAATATAVALPTGLVAAAVKSLAEGLKRLETPHVAIR